MEHDNMTTLSLDLEGFSEPLNITLSKTIEKDEFNELTAEIISNYILNLKEKHKIPNDRNDLIIISSVYFFNGRKTTKRLTKQTLVCSKDTQRSFLVSVESRN
jgi:hypothetical protein